MSVVPDRRSSGWGVSEDGPGRFGLFWIAVWTFFLLEPLSTGWDHRDRVSGWVGILATLAFGVVYVLCFRQARLELRQRHGTHMRPPVAAAWFAVEVVLSLVVMMALGQVGTATVVYLCVMSVMLFRNPWSIVGAAVLAAACYTSGFVVAGWSRDNGLLLSMLTATAAVWGIQQMMLGNAELRIANRENRRLVVEEERTRFARDLHDILGHSLTVITVKAELAQRLVDVDLDRTRAELADLERLSRDALADVRRAVEGYRELTLPAELARARTALAAAEIDAEVPGAADEVPSELRELFAWTVREGVTNVIRHSGASRCRVVLSPSSAEVTDDGAGPSDLVAPGSGLTGLRERAATVGARVITSDLAPGYRLQVVR